MKHVTLHGVILTSFAIDWVSEGGVEESLWSAQVDVNKSEIRHGVDIYYVVVDYGSDNHREKIISMGVVKGSEFQLVWPHDLDPTGIRIVENSQLFKDTEKPSRIELIKIDDIFALAAMLPGPRTKLR